MVVRRHDHPFGLGSATQPQFITLSRKGSTSFDDKDDSPFKDLATEEIESGIVALKSDLGESHPDVAVALDALGDACRKNGDHDEALRFYQEALALKQKNSGRRRFSDPSVGETLFAMGELHRERLSLNDSLGRFEDALLIFESYLFGKEEPVLSATRMDTVMKIVSTKNSMGSIKFQQRRFDDALEDYNDALESAKIAIDDAENSALIDSMGENPADGEQPSLECVWVQDKVRAIRLHIADTLSNIASVHSERSEWRSAISRYNEALEIQVEELGEDDPDVANTLTNIGTMNFRFGNHTLALKSYKQAWKMRKTFLGPSHIDVSDALLNVALVHEQMGNTSRAEANYLHALQVAKKAVGDRHMKIATLKNSLATIFLRTDREDLAVQFFSEAWAICKVNGLDDKHHLAKTASKNIADIRFKNQDDLASVMASFYDVLNFFSEMGVSAFSLEDPGVDSFLKNISQANTKFSMAVC